MKKFLFLSSLLFVFSCASHKAPEPKQSTQKKEGEMSLDESTHRYAVVYNAFDDFKWLERLLMLKMESKEVHDVVEDLSDTGKKIKERLDELQKGYPNLSFEDKDRSEVSKHKGKLQTEDRLKSFLPLVGKQGPDFERSLLLFVANTTNELKYRLQALADLEKNPSLKRFDEDMHDQAMRLEDRALKILNEKHFRKNFYKPQTPIAKERK